ncbi:phospholipid phosphatase 3-like [Lethenteron reissneri]|uniref:phospholipid phosphatase 3-like n=1 Tax=Lethenteron reissneri TaxID=7753 RepID=UPI002AB6B72B|nr:phospholipid phosphatase 3-like [Lethenteron reissneri]
MVSKMTLARTAATICADVFCIFLAFLPVAVLYLSGAAPFQRGFFCDDATIAYPYRDSTISSGTLMAVGFSLALLSIAWGEFVSVRYGGDRPCSSSSSSTATSGPPAMSGGGPLRDPLAAALYARIGSFLLGAALSQALTETAKFSIGRLRPHFLDVCRPNATALGAECAAHVGGTPSYVQGELCTGEPHVIREARKSFYSGHASFSMYTMVFLAARHTLSQNINKHAATSTQKLKQLLLPDESHELDK